MSKKPALGLGWGAWDCDGVRWVGRGLFGELVFDHFLGAFIEIKFLKILFC